MGVTHKTRDFPLLQMASALGVRRLRFFLADPNPSGIIRRIEGITLQHIRGAHRCHFKLPTEIACKGNAWGRSELGGTAYARSILLLRRSFSDRGSKYYTANKNTSVYVAAIAVLVLGLSYAAVPLYRLYCQVRACVRACVRCVCVFACACVHVFVIMRAPVQVWINLR